jgi:biopolymer transport protein ExbD
MKIRTRQEEAKFEVPMAPMIDVVFQLLIFFMLTLKIVTEEGDFDINMPVSSAATQVEQKPIVEYKVRLLADANGNLRDIQVGENSLGNDVPACFQRLNNNVRSWAASGGSYSDDLEVEIDADYGLHYQYTIKAVSACTGYLQGDRKVKFLDKIKFAPPRRPQGAAPEA